MPKNRDRIPLSPLKREFYSDEISEVSKEAVEELRDWIEEYAKKISRKAIEISKVSGNKTLREGDIKTALKIIKER
ncbi:MAG: hypothetical protein PWQ28_494 [Candidatus Woesearchaeota archaeon]|nr:hypothetical protein [Candidatus Woesearchaeota archaeon]